MVESSHSTTGLVIISKLYSEGLIDDESREKLKDMIFSEDGILLSLLERYEDEEELKQAVLKYVNGGVLEAKRPIEIQAVKGDPSELDQASSPTDSALDFKKRKRLNQQAAKKTDEHGVIGVSDCDMGASPQMSKLGISLQGPNKMMRGKMSPLAQVRFFSLKNSSQQQ